LSPFAFGPPRAAKFPIARLPALSMVAATNCYTELRAGHE